MVVPARVRAGCRVPAGGQQAMAWHAVGSGQRVALDYYRGVEKQEA